MNPKSQTPVLVTHEGGCHPEEYLYDALDERFEDDARWEYVDQYGS